MGGEKVILQVDGFMGIITLSREEEKNKIDAQMVSEFKDISTRIKADDIRVVVITGKGDAFSIGTDREYTSSLMDMGIALEKISISSIVGAFPCPTIAAINGDALGQGLELALACDIRISAENARFSMPQVTFGEIPWDGGTQRLARIVGRGKALEMILTGESIDAMEAYRVGLVNRVVPRNELMNEAISLANEMVNKGPIALRFAKEAVLKGMDLTLEQGLRLEADLYFLLHTTRDRTEGITAFREKRPPTFEGR